MTTLDDLSRRTHEPVEELQRWRALALITGDDDQAGADAERIRLIQFARRRGIAPEQVARLHDEQGDVIGTFIDLLVRTAGKRDGRSRDEVLTSVGVDKDFAERIWIAAGLGDQTEVFDDDLEALRWIEQARQAGFPDDAILQLVRVYTDALNRVADAENRLFHYYVHEQFRRDGLTGHELMNATSTVSQSLVGLVEPALLYFHGKAWERALREDLMLHLVEDARGQPAPVPGTMHVTTMFVDLASFTTLTSALGDQAGAQTLDRFSDLVRAATVRYDGRLVKQIGDAFMLVFSDATRAVEFALDVRDAASAEADFPAVRIGAHTGEVLYREGDFVGTNVNIAARVAALAQRGQVLVTDATRNAAAADARFSALGARHLKGISEDVDVFETTR